MQVSRQGVLHLQLHVAILKLALHGQGVAVLPDVGDIGDLGQVQLFSDLGANLGSVAVDGLTAAENDVLRADADLIDGSCQDLGR